MKVRFTIGSKQMFQLEKARKILFHSGTDTFEIHLADNIGVIFMGEDEVKAWKASQMDKSKMN